MAESKGGSSTRKPPKGRTAAEWTTLGMSLALVVGLMAIVVYVQVWGPSAPTEISVKTDVANMWEGDGFYYVPVTITNTGEETGEDVLAEITLTSGGKEEVSEVQVRFLPAGGDESAVAVFSSDPSQGELSTRPASFLQPQ